MSHHFLKYISALSCVILLSSCAPAGTQRPQTAPLADGGNVNIMGDPVRCLQAISIRNTKIIDDGTIDFDTGAKLYRNRLPARCPGLKSADKFSYTVSTGSLCNADIIYVLNDYGGEMQRGISCGLGEFVPIQKIKPAI